MMVFLRPGADRHCGSSGSGPSSKRNGFTPLCPSQGGACRRSWLSDHQKELGVPSWPTNQAEGMHRLARPRKIRTDSMYRVVGKSFAKPLSASEGDGCQVMLQQMLEMLLS
ncbi:unnamed protein product [Symbiodinium sp. CCMP2592]|nr:unnamed protein product [Symbiodinium sp. CCMP2592]